MSLKTHSVIRARLIAKAGIHEPAPLKGCSFDTLLKQECSDGFCEMMNNRLVMGRLRYGPARHKKPRSYDVNKAMAMIRRYQMTGNAEFLVDAANWCRLEFNRGVHPNKHFKASDR